MKKKNIGINAVLNVIKSALSVLFPLITYPYALRVLGAEGIGKVSYSASIVSYFSLLAMLGVNTYGVREGAKKNNETDLRKFVNEVFSINLISTIFAYVLLILSVSFMPKLESYSKLIYLQSASILLTTLGMEWINVLYEDFLLITVRSIITHIITMACLFIFVKTPNDYYIYALLTVLANGIVCVSNWFYIRKYLKVSFTFHLNIKRHIKPLLYLFSNAVAISVYVNFDTTMLGWIKGDIAVGYYTVAVRIYSIIKSMLASVYAVAIPRLASYIGNTNYCAYKELYTKVCNWLSVILVPAGVGLICVSEEIMMFMGGKEYLNATPTLQILAIALIFSIYGGLVTAVLNVTIGREKDNLVATVLSALINCILNLFFIPLLDQNGAAITTVISEAFVFVFCLVKINNKELYIEKKSIMRVLNDAIVGSLFIIIISVCVKWMIGNWIIRLLVTIITSLIVYFIYMLIRKNEIILDFLVKVEKKIGKKRSE